MISHKHQFIFVHIPKCAGTSITAGLKDCKLERVGHHDRLSRLTKISRKKNDSEVDYFTFTCIRNIYAQLISMVFSRHGTWNKINFIAMVRQMDVRSVMDGPSWSAARIKKYINEPIDFVMRFENLEEDWRTLLAKLQLPWRPLPHKKSNPNKKHYSHYYDQEMIDLVSKTFADEIAKYGWEFERK